MLPNLQKHEADGRSPSPDDMSILSSQVDQINEGQQLQVSGLLSRRGLLYRASRVVLPLTAFPLALLVIVYLRRHIKSDAGTGGLQAAGNGTFTSYPRFYGCNTVILDFITSWSGPVSLGLTGSVVILFLLFVTPFSALYESRGGEVSDGKTLRVYRKALLPGTQRSSVDLLSPAASHQKMTAATTPLVFKAVRIIGIMVALSLLIQATGTWLQVSSVTAKYTRAVPQIARHSFGRGISEATRNWLANSSNADQGTGTLIPRYNNRITESTLQVWLRNSSTAYQTLEDRSPVNAIATYQSSNQTFAYLREKTTPTNLDYNATTVEASTSCLPIKLRCANSPFDPCPTFPFNFGSALPHSPMIFRLFNDSAPSFNNKSSYTSPTNPFSWGFYANIDGWDYPDDLWSQNPFARDMNVIVSSATLPSLIVMMYCNTTVYNITYSIVNGIVDRFQAAVGNNTLSGLIGSPMFPVSSDKPESDRDIVPPSEMDVWPGFDREVLNLGLRAATSGNTSYDIAHSWSTVFSRAAVASAAGVMERRRNIAESSHETILTTEWPKLPSYILIILDLLYAISVMVLLGLLSLH